VPNLADREEAGNRQWAFIYTHVADDGEFRAARALTSLKHADE